MTDDLISRQAAIDAIIKAFDRGTLLNSLVRKVAVDAVKVLPSAVVRCKDCKYNKKNPRRWADDDPIESYCWCEYMAENNGFCSCGKHKDGDPDA